MNFTILRFDSLESTNTEAVKQARLGADEGLCVLARKQTSGRGRMGRTWVSEKDSGLYLSIVLRPEMSYENIPLITLMAGVAVFESLGEFGIKADIKWVNDVLVAEKKISGILAEAFETPKGLAVVVGIGINLTNANFVDHLAGSATSIEVETGLVITPDELAEIVTKYVRYFYDILIGPCGAAIIVDEWRKRSSYYSGKNVSVVLENESFNGVTDGLESNGAIRVRRADGTISIVQAGDIEKLRAEQ